MARFAKTLTALVSGVLGWGAQVVASKPHPVTASEWLGLAVIGAVSLGVYAVPNTPAAPPAGVSPQAAPLVPAEGGGV